MPIYFFSKILPQREVNYPPIEKLVYALTHTARWLRHYFQAHSILVMTDQPIKHILRNPESSGRLAKWAIELAEYEINFSPRHAVKGQILADFLLETTEKVDHLQKVKGSNYVWELHTDGASSEEGVGAGLVLTSPEGEEHTYALRFCFYASNNEAEYEALLSGLRIASEMGIKHLRAYVDSQIIAQQVNGGFETKDVSMKQYLQLVEKISKNFETLEVVQIPRNKNKKEDVLSKLATLTLDHLHKKVLVEVLKDKLVDEKVVIAIVKEGEPSWITPYVKYLKDGTLPADAVEARRIRVSAPLYVLENGVLYRKSFSGPNLRCLTPQQAIDVVKEMHEGLCAQHSGYRTVVGRIMRQGYYWQSIYKDTTEVIKTCDACQRHGTVQHLPKYDLISVSSAWPFCKWAIDMVGPFPRSVGNAKFLVVVIDFFNKWVESMVLAKITGENIKKFVWNDVVCRYGLPNEIVSDNGKQFADNPFRSWCEEINIKQTFTSVAHPQANGQVEVTNKEIVAGIKASTGETPFSLVYDTETVIPAEIRVPTQRVLAFDIENNSTVLRENLNLLEERRIMAAIRQAGAKQKMAKILQQASQICGIQGRGFSVER
ncbi:uncharacterized protein [Rutidosis leptorrhynchoides]|uniref:uncharacterized protein n=1 Tax=Rutidosis leptorrhynchoides TaxID=125765 RepID=UPI003A990AD8